MSALSAAAAPGTPLQSAEWGVGVGTGPVSVKLADFSMHVITP